jgi:hypothetical protein
MPEHIAPPPPSQIQFFIVSVEDMKRLHDSLLGINRLASFARLTAKASLVDQSCDFRRDLSESLVDVIRVSELERRDIYARLTRGPVTVTVTVTKTTPLEA